MNMKIQFFPLWNASLWHDILMKKKKLYSNTNRNISTGKIRWDTMYISVCLEYNISHILADYGTLISIIQPIKMFAKKWQMLCTYILLFYPPIRACCVENTERMREIERKRELKHLKILIITVSSSWSVIGWLSAADINNTNRWFKLARFYTYTFDSRRPDSGERIKILLCS